MAKNSIWFLFLLLLLWGCSGLEQSEEEELRRKNCKGEYIYRRQDGVFSPIETPRLTLRDLYPWEQKGEGQIPRITKEAFRCRGSHSHPVRVDASQSPERSFSDCAGRLSHGFPEIHGTEGVYPVLIDLLNYLQKKTSKRVIITSGHRCPIHNKYVDPSLSAQKSLHMIGAEVDFYLQGMENRPLEVVNLLLQFYKETPGYIGKKEYGSFFRCERSDLSLAPLPWYNKEIEVQIHERGEGRDRDNQHLYSYITIRVRFDRDLQEPIVFSWDRAKKLTDSSSIR